MDIISSIGNPGRDLRVAPADVGQPLMAAPLAQVSIKSGATLAVTTWQRLFKSGEPWGCMKLVCEAISLSPDFLSLRFCAPSVAPLYSSASLHGFYCLRLPKLTRPVIIFVATCFDLKKVKNFEED